MDRPSRLALSLPSRSSFSSIDRKLREEAQTSSKNLIVNQ